MREDDVRAHVKAAQSSLERAAKALEAQPSSQSSGLDLAREQLLILRRRNASFPAGMFGDYRWPMMLVLYIAHEEGREMRQRDAFSESGVPHTTGKRILDELGSLGMIQVRSGDHARARRLISLSPQGVERMRRFFGERLA
ncbi:MAG TPA: hypothetical protein VGB54_02360 [Allosphingosinicella sp.]|jgi:DNA-binding MarR family transcriptional regulator